MSTGISLESSKRSLSETSSDVVIPLGVDILLGGVVPSRTAFLLGEDVPGSSNVRQENDVSDIQEKHTELQL